MDRDTKSKFQLAMKSQRTATYSKLRRNKLDYSLIVLMFFKQLLKSRFPLQHKRKIIISFKEVVVVIPYH